MPRRTSSLNITPILQRSTGDTRKVVKALLAPIDLPHGTQLSNPQKQQLALVAASWAITACWLADPQAGKRRQRPFGNQGFQERKTQAQYLDKLMNLSEGVLKHTHCGPTEGFSYVEAWQWKIRLIYEWRNWRIDSLLSFDPKQSELQRQRVKKVKNDCQQPKQNPQKKNLFSRRQWIRDLRTLHEAIEGEDNPFNKEDYREIEHYELFKRAIQLVKLIAKHQSMMFSQSLIDFRAHCWRPYLESLDGYIKDLHKPNLKVALPYEDYLKYQAEGNYHANFDLSKSIVLKIDPVFMSELKAFK